MPAKLTTDPAITHPNAGVEHWSSDTPTPAPDATGPAATAARRAILRDAAPFVGALQLADAATLPWVRTPGRRLRPNEEAPFEQMGRARQRSGMYDLATLVAKDPAEGAADAAQGIDRYLAFRRAEDGTVQTVVVTRQRVRDQRFRSTEDGGYARTDARGYEDPSEEVWEGKVRLFQPDDEERYGVGFPEEGERRATYQVSSHPAQRKALDPKTWPSDVAPTPLSYAVTGIDRRVGEMVHEHLWRVFDGKESLHPLVAAARGVESHSLSSALETVTTAQQSADVQAAAPTAPRLPTRDASRPTLA